MTSEVRPTHALVLSWHAEEGAISAGGHRRTLELVRRFEAWGELTILDTRPTMFDIGGRSHVVPYRVPGLACLARIDRRLGRMVQWPWATLAMIRSGGRACRRAGVDVVYVPSSELLPCVLAGVVVSKLWRRRLVLCNMNAEGIALGGLVVALHNLADDVIALSPGLADALQGRGLRRAPHVVGCGTPVQEPPEPGITPHKEWDGVFVGRHTKDKGVLDLLEVWAAVRTQRPGSRLALVGSSSEEMGRLIDVRCQDLRLAGSVVRLGVLSEREKNAVLAASRILLFPSRIEGWGFVPQEALVRSVPVVCWDLPAYEASLPRHPAVVRIPTGDIEGMARAALTLLDQDNAALTALAAAAPMTMPSWDDVAEEEWAVLSLSGARP